MLITLPLLPNTIAAVKVAKNSKLREMFAVCNTEGLVSRFE